MMVVALRRVDWRPASRLRGTFVRFNKCSGSTMTAVRKTDSSNASHLSGEVQRSGGLLAYDSPMDVVPS